MTTEMLVVVLIAFLVFVVIFSPFFWGPGGALTDSIAVDSEDKLEKTKKLLLERYLKDQSAFEAGDITAKAWAARKAFIVHRYLDASRRLDFLRGSHEA